MPTKTPAKAPAKKPAPKKPLMDWQRKPIDTYRATLGSDKDIVARGNRTPYEPIPKKAKGGSVSARADGIAKKGKTKAKQVAMKRGGKC